MEAELLEYDAPRICGYIRSILPLDSTMVHAKFAGEETIVMVPFFAEQENGKTDVVAGDIGYYPGRQTLCLFYGETKPFGEVSYVARVRSTLTGWPAAGARSSRPVRCPCGWSGPDGDVSAATLVEELREFTAARWLDEPPDVARLREFTLPPMGNLPCGPALQLRPVLGGRAAPGLPPGRARRRPAAARAVLRDAMLLERTAARTAKWEMTETVTLLQKAASNPWPTRRPDTAWSSPSSSST